ncbi:MAG: YsnF/AvaK domain-containing protein [Pyrinomonadaceae bacterium]|nr:YsnF/AvaK domain-containing protein [Pyrinomonadaceae bacterium]
MSQTEDFNQSTVTSGDAAFTVIPVIEEKAVIEKNWVETGKVRVSKKVSENETLIDEPMFQEQVDVQRIAVNQYVTVTPPIRYEGETMIIPVMREAVFVEKRLVLVEELHVTKRLIENHNPQSVILRKEEVTVERMPVDETQQKT